MPDPIDQAGATPPAESGGVNPESGATDQTGQPDPPAGEPYFVAQTKEEFEARYGPTRTEGRLALAKKYGFETLDSMDQAMNRYKEMERAQETEAQRQAREAREANDRATAAQRELQTIKINDALKLAAEQAGADPAKLDAILALRPKSDAEIDENGNPIPTLLEHSIAQVLAEHPYFKRTVGAAGANPAPQPADKTPEQIAKEAQDKGDLMGSIRAQLAKLAPSTGATSS